MSDDDNIFTKLANKFKLAVKKVDVNNLPPDIRDKCINVERYKTALQEVYYDLMRVLNANPEYDPMKREDAYYVMNDSPGEKLCNTLAALRQFWWSQGKFTGYAMRLGLEVSEVEKLLQRDARKQLFHVRHFLFKDYPRFEDLRTRCIQAKNKWDCMNDGPKKQMLKHEYDAVRKQVVDFLTVQVPEAKRNHMRCLLYFMRCYREYHCALRVRYLGMGAVRPIRPGSIKSERKTKTASKPGSKPGSKHGSKHGSKNVSKRVAKRAH